jgi:FAD synthase
VRLFESLDLPRRFPNPVLTIRNYDGVHVGHNNHNIVTLKARGLPVIDVDDLSSHPLQI